MYRKLLFVTVCLHATWSAPQEDRKSEITYFKIQPVIKDNFEVTRKSSDKEQIITENPPLISTVDNVNMNASLNQSNIPETEVLSEPISDVINDTKTDKRSVYVNESSLNVIEASKSRSDKNKEIEPLDNAGENQNDENEEDNIPSETKSEREARDFEDQTTSSYETLNLNATEKFEEIAEDTRTSPKLSYFKKFGGASYNKNYIDNSSKRKFRSRCRCEKIWNCPKLQVTVPRCPEEQFMCCF